MVAALEVLKCQLQQVGLTPTGVGLSTVATGL
jgi:hypothetical protein